jgi:hypothetical protein
MALPTGGKESHFSMRRISRILTLTTGLGAGLALFAGLPVSAASAATNNSAIAGTTSATSSTATINVNAPSSTYAKVTFSSMQGGVQISKISISGVMTGKGCYQGNLYRNGKLTRQSQKVCAGKGKRVTVTWTGIGKAAIGTNFRMRFAGTGAPAGPEAFSVS